MSVLHDLIARGNDNATLRELLEEGENPNVADAGGNTPLHIAALKEVENEQELEANLQVVRELIYFVVNVNRQNNLGNTPLHFAVARRKYKMAEILLNCGAEIDAEDSFGNTALHYAINNEQLLHITTSNLDRPHENYSGDLEIVKLLMTFSPDVNLDNYDSETPLIWAVKQQNLQITQILVEEGALFNIKDTHGNEALHYALNRREINVEIVAELIRVGSSHASENGQSMTPVDVYLNRLSRASTSELEKAKHVFKLLAFRNNKFKFDCLKEIAKLSKRKKIVLHQFLWYCRYEVEKMKSDELAYKYTVYDLASSGFFSCICFPDPPEDEIFDKVLDKLKKGEYSVYCDIIISGICKKYLARIAAGTGCWTYLKGELREFLNYDTRNYLCYYLTNFEIFNLMLAFTSSKLPLKICKNCSLLNEKL